jgi:hypothetical protein
LDNSTIGFFGRLEKIDLRNNNISDNGIRTLALASRGFNLRYFNASRLRITDDTAYALATCCPNLEVLDLSYCPQITDVTLRLLGTYCPQLRQLNISGCGQISDEGLARLSSLPNMQQLAFSNCQGLDGLKLHHLRRLPLTELDISANQFPVKSFIKIPKYFPKLTKLNLANCVQVTDTLLELIITKCPALKHLNLESIPLLTNKTLHLLCFHHCLIESVNLQGNNQLDLNIIAALVKKGLHLIGGPVELIILRNRSHLEPIVLRAIDKFTPMTVIRERVLAQLREEKISVEDNWQLDDLLFQKVIYRKNGTKRPSAFVSEKEHSSVLAAVLGDKKNHLYLQTTKLPEEYTAAQQNIVLTIRRWSSEEKRPIDIGDLSVNPNITLREFKQMIHERYMPSVVVEKMLLVEEETPLHVNILLNNTITLKNYGLVSGDALHVEEITEQHYTPEGSVGNSSTAKFLSKQKTQFLIQETEESFTRRKCRALASNTKMIPREAINLEVRLSGWAKFEDLQRFISNVTGVPPKAQRLSTRVHSQVNLEGPQKSIVEVVSGNTWIMMEVM